MIFINQELLLLFLLANLITISVTVVGAANSSSSANSTCNRSCGEGKFARHVSYPFGFSEDCEIRLNCTAKPGWIHLAGCKIKNLTSDSIMLHFPANCTLKDTEIEPLFGEKYAPSWQNGFLFRNCSSSSQNGCVIPASILQTRFELHDCGGGGGARGKENMSCYASETLMKIVPFWRTSLSQSTQSLQYYFDHFVIHPVKIIATFLPAESYSSYDSTQEALRSLLHSVIKMPTIENMVVELYGVLVTHALVTIRELLIKCAQHYSWYSMGAIYIAKGSTLLPPSFASVFDDLASSSLDVFFDPSNNLLNMRGLTVGSFKLISRCIKDKGLSGTKRYFGDLEKTLKMAGSNILFAAVTEISDSVLKGAESSGFNGMVIGFHHGILKLAMEPTLLRSAFLEGGPDRKIWLDRSPGVDELYIEGYLQGMLDTVYKQEYLSVRVIDNQVILKNLPPNSSLIDEIMDRVKDFLVSKALLKGDTSRSSRPLRHLRVENDWRIGPTIRALCEHLFVNFSIRTFRKLTDTALAKIKEKGKWKVPVEDSTSLDSSKEMG